MLHCANMRGKSFKTHKKDVDFHVFQKLCLFLCVKLKSFLCIELLGNGCIGKFCRICHAFAALSNDNGNIVCFMRKHLFLLFSLLLAAMPLMAQRIVVPEGDSTFVTEFRNDEEWAVMAKDGIVVRLGNALVKGNYGRYWQIKVIVQNLSDSAFVFEPDGVTAALTSTSAIAIKPCRPRWEYAMCFMLTGRHPQRRLCTTS